MSEQQRDLEAAKRREEQDKALKDASILTQSADENWKRAGRIFLRLLKETYKDK